MTIQPLKIVMIRRGSSKISNVPSEKLVTFIRRKLLLGTDELSGDGNSWIRVDRHYQLRKYFLNDEEAVFGSNNKLKLNNPTEMISPSSLKDDLIEMAGLLKDINK